MTELSSHLFIRFSIPKQTHRPTINY